MNAQEIRELRARLGLTQEGLARKLGVSYWTVIRWEKGSRSPSPLALQALQRLLPPKLPPHSNKRNKS